MEPLVEESNYSLDDNHLEELDDEEFKIPNVEVLPSLESILQETCPGAGVNGTPSDEEQELSVSVGLDEIIDFGESSSVCSMESRNRRHRNRNQSKLEKHGPILKKSLLRGLSSQLQAACSDRINAGKPTALAIGSNFMAIGTSQGVTLVFDNHQLMKWCLRINDQDIGSVSALTLNDDCTRLLCGHSRGHIVLWNLVSGDLIKVVNDIHAPFTSVLHLKFTSDPNVVMLSDCGGSVFQVFLRKGKKEMESMCIFSGSRGEVLALEPLIIPTTLHQNMGIFSDLCLVALATVTKVIVVSLIPAMAVHFTYPLKAEFNTCPLIAWQFVIIQMAPDVKVVDPVLAFGRQNVVYFFQATHRTPGKLSFGFLRFIQLSYTMQSLIWLNSRTIAVMDKLEHLHVLDVRSEEELEVVDISDVKLVYGTAFFKGLATGGNVSRAMAAAGERACYYSICCTNAFAASSSSTQILVLGQSSVFLYMLRSWTERIDWFLRQNNYTDALSLALSFYNDEAKTVIGLTGKKDEKRATVAKKIVDMINDYVDLGVTKLCPEKGRVDALFEHYQSLIPVCVDFSLSIGRPDLLTDKIYETFSGDYISKCVFLESLQTYILKGRISSLSPVIAQELMTYYADKKRFEDLEAMLVRLDISCIDIHQAMVFCRDESLYDGLIFIHNQAFGDYITPLQELFSQIKPKLSRKEHLSESEIIVGNKLLVYIACCLTGRSYPIGDLPDSKKNKIRVEVLNYITIFKSQNKDDEGTIYPNLKALLHFDSKEFLNVIALAFDDLDLAPEDTFSQSQSQSQSQRIIDILLHVMVESNDFMPSQVGALFTFLARQVSRSNSQILVSNLLFDQIIEYLTKCDDETRVEERQQALLELVQSGKMSHLGVDKLLALAEKAQFFRVCEYIYWEQRSFNKILKCYLRDQSRRLQVFAHINQILLNPSIEPEEKALFFNSVIQQVNALVAIDKNQTAKLLNDHLMNDNELEAILRTLESSPEVLYLLLDGFLNEKTNIYSNNDLDSNHSNFENSKNSKFTLLVDSVTHEKYLELMCVFQPEAVASFLRESEAYRPQNALAICRQHHVKDGEAFLLEKEGEFQEAFSILFHEIQTLVSAAIEAGSVQETEKLVGRLETELNSIILFCQRCCEKLVTSEERELLWFPLLEEIVTLENNMRVKSLCREQLEDFVSSLLKGMMRYVSLLSLLHRILTDPSATGEKSGKVSSVKDLLMKMLDAYNYEATLFETTNSLLNSDLHHQLTHLTRDARRAYSSRNVTCSSCYLPFFEAEEVIIFRCHSFHVHCLDECDLSAASAGCPKCAHSATGSAGSAETAKRRISQSFPSQSVTRGTSIRRGDKSDPGLDALQGETLQHIKSCCRATPALQVLQQLSDKSTLTSSASKESKFLMSDRQLNLSPQWVSHSH